MPQNQQKWKFKCGLEFLSEKKEKYKLAIWQGLICLVNGNTETSNKGKQD